MPSDFWTALWSWPADPHGYTFLARALGKIGKAMFGVAWTGKEVTREPGRLLPDRMDASLDDQNRAADALFRTNTMFAEKVTRRLIALRKLQGRDPPDPLRLKKTGVPWSSIGGTRMSNKEWAEAEEVIKAASTEWTVGYRRFLKVGREIAKRCELGELISAVRRVEGGTMTTLGAEIWNTDRWRSRFLECRINPKEPFAKDYQPDPSWIFLTTESLDRFLLGQPFVDVDARMDSHLSPYLRLMLAVAKKLDIKPESQPKKDVVIAEIMATWTGSKPLSPSLASSMATLLREPESQLGRAKPPDSRTAGG